MTFVKMRPIDYLTAIEEQQVSIAYDSFGYWHIKKVKRNGEDNITLESISRGKTLTEALVSAFGSHKVVIEGITDV